MIVDGKVKPVRKAHPNLINEFLGSHPQETILSGLANTVPWAEDRHIHGGGGFAGIILLVQGNLDLVAARKRYQHVPVLQFNVPAVNVYVLPDSTVVDPQDTMVYLF
jgi:hypothetical protein